jgi:hypothetical protein
MNAKRPTRDKIAKQIKTIRPIALLIAIFGDSRERISEFQLSLGSTATFVVGHTSVAPHFHFLFAFTMRTRLQLQQDFNVLNGGLAWRGDMVSSLRSSVCMESSSPKRLTMHADAFSVVHLNKGQERSSRSSPAPKLVRSKSLSITDLHGTLTLAPFTQQHIRTDPQLQQPSGMQHSRKQTEFQHDSFEWRRIIGHGTFGRVAAARILHGPQAGQMVAIKSVSKAFALAQGQINHLRNEQRLLSHMKYKFIVSYHGSFQDSEFVYFVLEFVAGGDFFKLLRERQAKAEEEDAVGGADSMDVDLTPSDRRDRAEGDKKTRRCLPEIEARFYAGQIVLALSYLSQCKITYRDLKPENIMVAESGYLKLTDFGFAKRLNGSKTYTFCGTPGE